MTPGRSRGRRRTPSRLVHGLSAMAEGNGYLRISELAERSGVSAGTIKHYLREGLLGSDDDDLSARRGTWPTTRRNSCSGSS